MKVFEGLPMQVFGWVSYAFINIVQKVTGEVTKAEKFDIIELKKMEQDLINAQLMTVLLAGLIITSLITIIKVINAWLRKEDIKEGTKPPVSPQDLLG